MSDIQRIYFKVKYLVFGAITSRQALDVARRSLGVANMVFMKVRAV